MAKYRKKPVVIEAIQFTLTRSSITEVYRFIHGEDSVKLNCRMADDYWDMYCDGIIKDGVFRIKTLESDSETQVASPNDFIIKGVQGECYPCKPDIFQATYEQV